jgi:hypothetical protein
MHCVDRLVRVCRQPGLASEEATARPSNNVCFAETFEEMSRISVNQNENDSYSPESNILNNVDFLV